MAPLVQDTNVLKNYYYWTWAWRPDLRFWTGKKTKKYTYPPVGGLRVWVKKCKSRAKTSVNSTFQSFNEYFPLFIALLFWPISLLENHRRFNQGRKIDHQFTKPTKNRVKLSTEISHYGPFNWAERSPTWRVWGQWCLLSLQYHCSEILRSLGPLTRELQTE